MGGCTVIQLWENHHFGNGRGGWSQVRVLSVQCGGVILRYVGVAVFPAEIIKMLALVGFNLIMNKDGSINAGNRTSRHSSMVEQQKPVCRTFDSSWRLKNAEEGDVK